MFRLSPRRWQGNAPANVKAAVTTNLVGGLGNQMFLFANLLATAERNSKGPGGVVLPVLPREHTSASVFESKPTYWKTIFKGLDSHVLHGFPKLPAGKQYQSTSPVVRGPM